MDRQIIFPGQIPLETDLLNTNRNVLIALGMLAQDLLGTSTLVSGLACTPNSPAAMNVLVAPGRIYSLQNVDNTAYSSLAANTTNQIVKQGISLATTTLACAAPSTVGYSVNYLIEAAYQDVDANAVALPYYNSSNPTQPYSGPANSGAAQSTTRQGQLVLVAKPGIAATTGSQVTPSADSGYVGLYVVTVAYGQTSIVAGNISAYSGGPFLTETLTQKLSQTTGDARYALKTMGISWQTAQTGAFTAVAGYGYPTNTTSAAITATLPASPTAGALVAFTDYAGTFATNNLTINPNGNKINGSTSNARLSTNGASVMLVYVDSVQGWLPVFGSLYSPFSAPYSINYLVVGGGGGGGGGAGGGGGGGGVLQGAAQLISGNTYTVTVGSGGAGGTGTAAATTPGTAGGNSSISGIATALGGGGGGGWNGSTTTGLAGGSGGSGGGGGQGTISGSNGVVSGGLGTSGQGYAGGNSQQTNEAAGGGGAGSVGANINGSFYGGAGGVGVQSSISGTASYYGGGGGGGTYQNGSVGGLGGGGGANVNSTGIAGTANTGGGGGGGWSGSAGGNGGSGIVVIAYLGPQRFTAGVVTTNGLYVIHTFLTSTTFTA